MEKVEFDAPKTNWIEEDNARIRRENRKFVLRSARKVVKWSLITAGVVAVANRLSNKDNPEETTEEV